MINHSVNLHLQTGAIRARLHGLVVGCRRLPAADCLSDVFFLPFVGQFGTSATPGPGPGDKDAVQSQEALVVSSGYLTLPHSFEFPCLSQGGANLFHFRLFQFGIA